MFGIESVCHAHVKMDFLKEARRVTKPGGRRAVVDLFLNREELEALEPNIYTKAIEGWALPNPATTGGCPGPLRQAGFERGLATCGVFVAVRP